MKATAKPFTLRPYQRSAIDSTYEYLSGGKGENPLIVAPTGAGKTAIIAQIVKDALKWDGRIIILAHVKELLLQGVDGLRKMCPEADIGLYSAGLKKKQTDKQVTFAGIQSIYNKVDKIGAADIILIDEAHMIPRRKDSRYGSFLSRMREINPKVKFIGLTATPYRLDSGMLHKGKHAMFDGISYDIKIGDLINDGYLSSVVSRAVDKEIDLTNVRKTAGDFNEHDLALAASDPELVASAVREITTLGKDRKSWLIFASGVDHAYLVAETITDKGVHSEVITGECDAASRADKIARFKSGELRCLINVNVLTTGFDAPNIDLIAILRATESTGLYVQIVGRGTRLNPGKKDCLILDYGGNVDRHGLIDGLSPKKKGGGGGGEAPVKVCKKCQKHCPTGCLVCPHCGNEFPPRELNHDRRSYSGALLGQRDEPVWHKVDDVRYYRHVKHGKPDSVKVTYRCGLNYYYDWLCPEHGGYATMKYLKLCPVLGSTAKSTEEALRQARNWKKPRMIMVVKDGKYDKIKQFQY